MKRLALVGAPNSGKTTLYNWLTGSRYKTVNYPGATVEYAEGDLAAHWGGGEFRLLDTPGVYSLNVKSQDEEVTLKALFDLPAGAVDGVIVVADGSQLERHLQLALQVKEAGFPLLLVVTMADLLQKQNLQLDRASLAAALGAGVVPYDGLLAGGVPEIVKALESLPDRGEVPPPVIGSGKNIWRGARAFARGPGQKPEVRR